MRNAVQQDISGLLGTWNDGDAGALNRLWDLLYPKLWRIAHQHLERRRAGESLESAALANEAYLKLVRAGRIRCQNRAYFVALCSQIMRRFLVDHARRRRSAKRGGDAPYVALDDALLTAEACGIELLALDEALDALARIDRALPPDIRSSGALVFEEAFRFNRGLRVARSAATAAPYQSKGVHQVPGGSALVSAGSHQKRES